MQLSTIQATSQHLFHANPIPEKAESRAVIIEENCIGCHLCVPVCPVNAILGAAKLMHTVISADCTGCQLCLAPCPVDCIVMQTLY